MKPAEEQKVKENMLIANLLGDYFEILEDTDGECFELHGSWDIILKNDFVFDNCIFAYHKNWSKLIPVIAKIHNLKDHYS